MTEEGKTTLSVIEKTYHFMAGLPRSGSTVLASILNQNPAVYVTPTSPLLDQLISNREIWENLSTVKANPIPIQLDNLTRGIINAAWKHIDSDIIIDKNRGWAMNMPSAEILFKKPLKMVATVRDLPSIMASWLVLLRANPDSMMDKSLAERGIIPTDKSRMEAMWEDMVYSCYKSLMQATVDRPNQVLLIDYDCLVNDCDTQLKRIHEFLDLPEYEYDLNNIKSSTMDDDLSAWGLKDMHSIRTSLSKTSKNPREILGEELYNQFSRIDKEFWETVGKI